MFRLALVCLATLGLATPSIADRGTPPRTLGICSAPIWIVTGDQLDGRFGTVAPAGDVNGDGFADVIVGAYNYDHPEVDEGVVFLYLGSHQGLSPIATWIGESDQAGAQMGDKLSSAGDVNGDGFDDVIVGAGSYDDGETDEGAAFLYLGSPTGLSARPAWMTEGNQANAQFGACVQAAGDVNGDGYDDVIVGSWLYDHGDADEGAAFVYLGSDSGLADVPAWMGESDSYAAVYGYYCGSAGDVNGDGFDDIAVGARRFSGNGLDKEGRVYVYYGSPTGPSPTPSWVHDGGQYRGEFGAAVLTAGDVNGDGYGDLIVGAFRYDHGSRDEGMAFVFLGSATGLSDAPAWTGEADQADAYFGYSVAGAGDINRDGYDDISLSASTYDVSGTVDAGRVYLYLGSASGLEPDPAWIQDGDQAGAKLESVHGVGDVNGDGYDDVMTGTLYHDDVAMDSGRAYLFYGCPNGVAGVPRESAASLSLEAVGSNPFTHSTALGFSLPVRGRVLVTVLDPSGRQVARLLDADVEAGRHVVTWDGRTNDGSSARAGIYLIQLMTDGGARGLKVVRLP
jgi:hypothetical protein